MNRILFFDGYCSLCNFWVDRILVLDKNKKLKFAPLQGTTAKQFLPTESTIGTTAETIFYLRNGKIYDRSTAILFSLYDIGGVWAIFIILIIIPAFLRNLIYDFVAKYRYKWFGRSETCRIPTSEEKSQFLP